MKKITLHLPGANELMLKTRKILPPGGRAHTKHKGKGSYNRTRAKRNNKHDS